MTKAVFMSWSGLMESMLIFVRNNLHNVVIQSLEIELKVFFWIMLKIYVSIELFMYKMISDLDFFY